MTHPHPVDTLKPQGYRSEIDGLRAICIGLVVLFHVDFLLIPGGFVGVDAFFVLSGYLITGLLLKEARETGRIHFGRFLARRIRRLLPAASLVLLATIITAAVLLPPWEIPRANGDMLAAALYVVNWRLAWQAVDYLDTGTQESLFLHFWSLSVEEQFYIIWPLLLILLLAGMRLFGKRSDGDQAQKGIAILLVILLVTSFSHAIWITQQSQPYAFFGTFARGWQLLAGGALALLTVGVASVAWRTVLAWSGLVLLLLSALLVSRETLYPGFWALMPTLGTCGLLLSLHHGQRMPPFLAQILTSRPFVFTGRISYAWYLWHWPVIQFHTRLLPDLAPIFLILPMIVSFLLAWATHIWLENPIRYGRPDFWLPRRAYMLGLACAAAALLVFNHLDRLQEQDRIYLSDGQVLSIEAIEDDIPVIYAHDCHLDQRDEKAHKPCIYGDREGERAVMLIGDSHGAHWFPALNKAAKEQGWRLYARTKSACNILATPLWNIQYNRVYHECATYWQWLLNEIATLQPEVIVVSAYVHAVVSEQTMRRVDNGDISSIMEQRERASLEDLRRITSARIVLLRDTPRREDGDGPVECLSRHQGNEDKCTLPAAQALARSGFPYSRAAQEIPGVALLDFTEQICPNGFCPLIQDGQVTMRDHSHLSAGYAESFWSQFAALLHESQRAAVQP